MVDFIKKNNLHDVVLVGHSFGGTIIAKVTEQVPNDIRRLVFLNAFIPKDGESIWIRYRKMHRKFSNR